MRTLLDYLLDPPIGHGRGTVIHRGRRVPGEQLFAVKMAGPGLDPGQRGAVQARLRREADVLSSVSNPGLIELIEVIEIPRARGRLRLSGATDAPEPPADVALVLAWAGGGSLAQMARLGHLDAATVVEMGSQVGQALAALHAADVIHGDISPGNVLHAHEHRWLLADLGEARRSGDRSPRTRRGTDGFTPPEVLAGAVVDEAGDVFALGRVLSTALGTRPPMVAPREADAELMHLRELIDRATATDPARRPPAAELAAALAGLRVPIATPTFVDAGVSIDPGIVTRDIDLPGLVLPPPPPPSRVRGKVRLATAAAAGAVVVALLALLGVRLVAPDLATTSGRSAGEVAADHREVPSVDLGHEPPARLPCPGSTGATPAGATAVPGDVDGIGCTVEVVWWADRAEVERPDPSGARLRFTLGRPGDQLLLGDWDGDGRDTPAVYDPVAGTVVRFDGWARPGEALTGTEIRSDAPLGGVARVHRVEGADQVTFDPTPS